MQTVCKPVPAGMLDDEPINMHVLCKEIGEPILLTIYESSGLVYIIIISPDNRLSFDGVSIFQ